MTSELTPTEAIALIKRGASQCREQIPGPLLTTLATFDMNNIGHPLFRSLKEVDGREHLQRGGTVLVLSTEIDDMTMVAFVLAMLTATTEWHTQVHPLLHNRQPGEKYIRTNESERPDDPDCRTETWAFPRECPPKFSYKTSQECLDRLLSKERGVSEGFSEYERLLIVGSFGLEPNTETPRRKLEGFLMGRHAKRYPTVILSNLIRQEILNDFSENLTRLLFNEQLTRVVEYYPSPKGENDE